MSYAMQILDTQDDYVVTDVLLHSLALVTAITVGTDFFSRLVEEVGRSLQAEQVFLTELITEDCSRARMLAYWNKTQLVENLEYDLTPFPCERVIATRKIYYYPRDVNQHFPAEGKRESYLGIPLESANGDILGHFVVTHLVPTDFSANTLSALRVFAVRAAAELERLRLREERAQLTRDLHDAVSQTLWSAMLIADVLPEIWEKDRVRGRQRLDQLKQLNRMALAEMRTLLSALRTKSQIEADLGDLIQHLVNIMQLQTPTQLQFTCDGQPLLLEASVQVGIYRIVQEALNNIIRHAHAQHALIQLTYFADELHLTIMDDGIGFDVDITRINHFGLKTMQERAGFLGLAFTITSQPQQGTTIQVSWKSS